MNFFCWWYGHKWQPVSGAIYLHEYGKEPETITGETERCARCGLLKGDTAVLRFRYLEVVEPIRVEGHGCRIEGLALDGQRIPREP